MNKIKKHSYQAIVYIENIGLLVIAIATIIAIVHEVAAMVGRQTVTLADLLLLFIYLEVLAMVAMYLDSGKLPVRMPIYIAIVALARYLILDIKAMDNFRIIAISGGMLILAITILAVRFGHCKFPYVDDGKNL